MDIVDLARTSWSSTWHEEATAAFKELFGGDGRYQAANSKLVDIRSPFLPDGVPFAALIAPGNPSSGAYAGMSFVLFPSETDSCLAALVVGTLGLGDDGEILGRPGHARLARAFTRWLNDKYGRGGQIAWAKSDPTRIDIGVPKEVTAAFGQHAASLKRYGDVIYAAALVSKTDAEEAAACVLGFIDICMAERGATPLAHAKADTERRKSNYLAGVMPDLDAESVVGILKTRRFVVVEGPPGTGKTRLARELLRGPYRDNGTTVQLHPGTTYEDFIGGLAPSSHTGQLGLTFAPKPGILMKAIDAAEQSSPQLYLLHLDEINRADLSKVLGEAIYLLEPRPEDTREVALNFEFPTSKPRSVLSIPENLHILGTMNSADRSIAILDVAVRRRFAFARLWPQRSAVEQYGCKTALEAYDRLFRIFVDWARDEVLGLMPGHSYFLEPDAEQVKRSLQLNLVPLLHEYLAQGYLGGFEEEVLQFVQWVESLA